MWPLITNSAILVVPSRRSNGSVIRIFRFETRLWNHCCAACCSLVVKIVHYFYLFLSKITIPYRFLRSSCRDTLHIVTLASTAPFEHHDLRRADAEEILSLNYNRSNNCLRNECVPLSMEIVTYLKHHWKWVYSTMRAYQLGPIHILFANFNKPFIGLEKVKVFPIIVLRHLQSRLVVYIRLIVWLTFKCVKAEECHSRMCTGMILSSLHIIDSTIR